MDNIFLQFDKAVGDMKIMHAVNNGPYHKTGGGQLRSNLATYKAAKIPYARNHDAAFFWHYGGEHTVDISAVFPDFDADPTKEENYDFVCTDEYVRQLEEAGTKMFYRLGSKIEHGVKKYGTVPPKDFGKWAVICEHIIRHYTEGWANGFHKDMPYWEIWNEADMTEGGEITTWGGTKEQFFELYAITAKHLKQCFPHLKIGGPAMCTVWHENWMRAFLEKLQKEQTPLDFFSWHLYAADPHRTTVDAEKARRLLDEYGYTGAESILNEWNYVADWNERFVESIEAIIGMKGAAYTAACMCEGQNAPVDMLMYYDARPCAFNGMFDFYTLRPLKGYYPFLMFSKLYEKGTQTACSIDGSDLYAIAAANADSAAAMICYYTDEKDALPKEITLTCSGAKEAMRLYLLDDTHDAQKVLETDAQTITVTMQPNTVLFVTNQAL